MKTTNFLLSLYYGRQPSPIGQIHFRQVVKYKVFAQRGLMGVQQPEINLRKQVCKFHAHFLL